MGEFIHTKIYNMHLQINLDLLVLPLEVNVVQ